MHNSNYLLAISNAVKCRRKLERDGDLFKKPSCKRPFAVVSDSDLEQWADVTGLDLLIHCSVHAHVCQSHKLKHYYSHPPTHTTMSSYKKSLRKSLEIVKACRIPFWCQTNRVNAKLSNHSQEKVSTADLL